MIGFTVNDLFYIAAIINYALQCQLITFLINVTVERICRNCWRVDHAIKVHAYSYIHSLKFERHTLLDIAHHLCIINQLNVIEC